MRPNAKWSRSWAAFSGLARPRAPADKSSRTLTTKKAYRAGTHRAVHPSATIARVDRHRGALGITRLADITGLDYLGVPVFAAMRPNARSISVSQGKGLTPDAAAASALMEAAEIAHAERAPRSIARGTSRQISKHERVADVRQLARLQDENCDKTTIEWVRGQDLASGEPVFVPYDLVHTDYTRPPSRLFAQSSNGLASGNHRLEAVIAGLCEVIERDALAHWQMLEFEERAQSRIRPDTIRDKNARALLALLSERGMSVSVWNATGDIGVACIVCRLAEALGNDRSSLGAFWGAGCHLDRGVALVRAVTEAAQSRLTYIAGVRDDIQRRHYCVRREASPFAHVLDQAELERAGTRFCTIPSLAAATFEADRDQIIARLACAGLEQAIAVDLDDEEIQLPVVRMIVPGLGVHRPTERAWHGSYLRPMRPHA